MVVVVNPFVCTEVRLQLVEIFVVVEKELSILDLFNFSVVPTTEELAEYVVLGLVKVGTASVIAMLVELAERF